MSDNTDIAEYAVCELCPSIPVITDGPDRETAPTDFLNINCIYLVYTKIYIIQVYTWYILGNKLVYIYSKSIYLAYTRNMAIQKEYIWCIPGIYQVEFENIPGIYLVYDNIQEFTCYIPGVFQLKRIYMEYP
jgi:hypothetical protein